MRVIGFFLVLVYILYVDSSQYADQLYEDLLYSYQKIVRPILNNSDTIKVKFGASLIRIIDVDEVNQVLTTNLWMEMQWFDYRLSWLPSKFGGIRKLHLPSDQIWIPDIILYTNADGEPHITTMSDALVYFNGLVVWKPPSTYKSFCAINIEYFPYDSQSCKLKFGGWSYNGFILDVRQLPSPDSPIINIVENGKDVQFMSRAMDLSGFYPYSSLEWDLMSLTSKRHEELYPGCCGQEFYIDVTFYMDIRRKTLFYTINLVIPCMLIAFLTTFVFYIPPIEHKMCYSISVLVALIIFYLVLAELIPPTSLVIPLIGKYLLFTMLLVALSIVLSVVSLNFYRRDGSAHPMPHYANVLFIQTLPKYLWMKSAGPDDVSDKGSSMSEIPPLDTSRRPSPFFLPVPAPLQTEEMRLSQLAQLRGLHPDLIRRMVDNVAFIADHFRAIKKEDKVSEDWSYVANVIDRLFLIIFTAVNIAGTLLIVVNSPILSESELPMAIGTQTKPLSGDTFENAFKYNNFTQESWWENTLDI